MRPDSIYTDGVEIRLRSRTPKWTVWYLCPSVIALTQQKINNVPNVEVVDLDEMVVIPRSPDVFSNINPAAVVDNSLLYFATEEQPCWVFTGVVFSKTFPFSVTLGLTNGNLGTMTLFKNGLECYTVEQNRLTSQHKIRGPGQIALRFTVDGAPCIIRLIISK